MSTGARQHNNSPVAQGDRSAPEPLREVPSNSEPEKLLSIVPANSAGLPKRQKIVLDHKIRAKTTALDWVCFVVYILSLYGFLVLMIYLLLKATKDDSQTTGIVYFSLFMFFVLVLVTWVTYWQRKQRKAEFEEARKRELEEQ